jgi:hypothetical protein
MIKITKVTSIRIIRMTMSRRMRWAGHVARMEANRNAYKSLIRKLEGSRPPGKPRRRWVDNIRMDLGEVDWSDVDWIGLDQDRNRWRALANVTMNLQLPNIAGKLLHNYRLHLAMSMYGGAEVYLHHYQP